MGYIGAAYLVEIDAPITEITSITNTALKVGRDSHNLVDFSTDDTIILRVGNANEVELTSTALYPTTRDGVSLGTTDKEWSDLFLADGAVIVMGEGNDITFTHDGTTGLTIAATPITINSTGALTLDSSTDITLDADGGDDFFKDGGTTFGSATNTSGNLIIKSGTTTAATFAGANVTFAGTISSGAIDTGSSTITTTGLISGGSLDIDHVLINGTTIGHTDDTDLITVADGAVTIAGTIGSGAITSTAGLTGTQVDILAQGDLRLQDSSGGQYVALQAHATTTQSYTLTFPAAVAASAGQYLSSATDGTLSWATASSGVGLGMVLALG